MRVEQDVEISAERTITMQEPCTITMEEPCASSTWGIYPPCPCAKGMVELAANNFWQELVYLGGIKEDYQNALKDVEQYRQNLQASRLENSRIHEVCHEIQCIFEHNAFKQVLKEHERVKRDLVALKGEIHSADTDRVRC